MDPLRTSNEVPRTVKIRNETETELTSVERKYVLKNCHIGHALGMTDNRLSKHEDCR